MVEVVVGTKKNAIIHLNFKVISFVVTIDRLRDGFFMLKNHFVYPASFAGWAFCSISICVVSIDCPNWPFCFHWILQHFIIIETVLGNSVRIRRVCVCVYGEDDFRKFQTKTIKSDYSLLNHPIHIEIFNLDFMVCLKSEQQMRGKRQNERSRKRRAKCSLAWAHTHSS